MEMDSTRVCKSFFVVLSFEQGDDMKSRLAGAKEESPDFTRGSQHAPVNSEPERKFLSLFSSPKEIRTCLLIFFPFRILCILVVGCHFMGPNMGKTQRLVLEATHVENKNYCNRHTRIVTGASMPFKRTPFRPQTTGIKAFSQDPIDRSVVSIVQMF
jgi:hypothetical protein